MCLIHLHPGMLITLHPKILVSRKSEVFTYLDTLIFASYDFRNYKIITKINDEAYN